MDLWQGPLREFVRAAESGGIAGDMTGRFVTLHGMLPSTAEVRSWDSSLRALAEALRDVGTAKVGVAVRGSARALTGPTAAGAGHGLAADAPDDRIGLCAEYHLPLTSYRIDVLLCGCDAESRETGLVLELKQWSEVSLEDDEATNVIVDSVEHAHPSQQALDYADWLTDYHSSFSEGGTVARASAYCHNLRAEAAACLQDGRFDALLHRSPLFVSGEEASLGEHVRRSVGTGDGIRVLGLITGGRFHPSPSVLSTLEDVLRKDERWHLLDEQRVAHDAVLAELRRATRRRNRSCVLVRGAPGTGKSVIAVQLLADALRLGLKAAHSTGGRAFTTALRSKFKGADQLFRWNMNLKGDPANALDLLLVDEAHRVRKTSDTLYTPKAHRTGKPQVEELVESAKVAVFFLDENQFVRPDEIGSSALVRDACRRMGVRLREYDLAAQFRCAGCEEYVAFVDRLLGFRDAAPTGWRDAYAFRLVRRPNELQEMVAAAHHAAERARIVAGFCWRWSDALEDGSLVPDVAIGPWSMPWNRKRDPKKRYRPDSDPYTRWAETDEGMHQVGCIYSAQGFEFDRVGVIWGPDLAWRSGAWVAQPERSFDAPVKRSGESMLDLVRNAYRVLLTRATRETVLLCLDGETADHVAEVLAEATPP